MYNAYQSEKKRKFEEMDKKQEDTTDTNKDYENQSVTNPVSTTHPDAILSAESILDNLGVNTDEAAVIAQLGETLLPRFTHKELIDISTKARVTQHTKVAEHILTWTLKPGNVDDNNLIRYFDPFFKTESLDLYKAFMERYQKMPDTLKTQDYNVLADALFLSDEALLKKFNPRVSTLARSVRTNQRNLTHERIFKGLLRAGRFELFDKAYNMHSKNLLKKMNDPDNLDALDDGLSNELNSVSAICNDIKDRYTLKNHSQSLGDFIRNNRSGILWDILARVRYLLQRQQVICQEILAELSGELEDALDEKEAGLSDKLTESFPKPKKSERIRCTNNLEYPAIDALNPHHVNIKKYSVLPEVLCRFLSEQGLMPKNTTSADKFLGFVTESDLPNDGIFQEAMYPALHHGKLSHLIQWYIIAHAAEMGHLDLEGMPLPLLLESMLVVQEKRGRETLFWEDALDVLSIRRGYCGPEHLFQSILLSGGCLGSYTRASLDNQLNHVLACYHKLPGTEKITKAMLFYAAILNEDNFVLGIAPHLSIIDIVTTHYSEKETSNGSGVKKYTVLGDKGENEGDGAAIIRKNKPS